MDEIGSLPGYEVIHRLAESDMASIWLARQVSLDRMVAIKVLHPNLVHDPEARARFQSEARTAARLSHPGLVQVYDAGEHKGLVYFVMEYVPGCTAAELLKNGKPLSERNALLIAQGVAIALGYAWEEERLIHCDIKPDNILIAADGSVKVADLGLARIMGDVTSLDSIEGTPHYCSPEQARGETDLDCRTDIYSLGATLYHMLTGRVPFGDLPPLEVLRRQQDDFLPDPMDINTSVAPATAWLVEKLMIKDRSVRHPDWSTALADIERVASGSLPHDPPPVGRSTVLRSERRVWPVSLAATHPVSRVSAVSGSSGGPTAKEPSGLSDVSARPDRKLKKIVISPDVHAAMHSRSAKNPARDVVQEWLYMFAAASTAMVVYGALAVYYYLASEPVTGRPAQETPAAPQNANRIRPAAPKELKTLLEQPTTAPSKPVPRDSIQKSAPAVESPRSSTGWTHPDYLRGVRLFNSALEQYKEYQRTKRNPSVLPLVEKQCREAIQAFEAVKASAPPEINIARLITQCYGLIENVRQSTLLAPAQSSQKGDGLSAIVEEAAVPPATTANETDDLVLNPSWNNPEINPSKRVLEDLERLLQAVAVPAVDLTADTSLMIFGQVFYLMPVSEAARIIGKPQGIRRRISTSGFPENSFFFYRQNGDFGNGFDTMVLITDSADRIVAVQLVSEQSSSEIWLEPTSFKTDWSVIDFVEGKAKGNAKWKIAHRVEKKNRVVQIDSELVSYDPNGYFELGESKTRTALYLPEPIANLILYRIDSLKKGLRATNSPH